MNGDSSQLLQLRGIHAPLDPLPWPPAPGWWLLAVILLLILMVISFWLRRRLRAARLRGRVLKELQALNGRTSDADHIARVSMVLKRVALAHYPRRQVAALSGQAWLAFLDRTGGDGRFQHGPGQVLASGPYAREPAVDRTALIDLGRAWVRKNL